MKTLLFILNLFLWPVCLFAQFDLNTVLPKAENSKIIKYSGFQVLFDTLNCIPVYSAYFITKDQILKPVKDRTKAEFINDAFVSCIKIDDYKNSGYDCGLLTPAIDMRYSEHAEHDCFYMTNICPQKRTFNAGIWERLERQVRDWANRYDSLVVITGPVINTCTRAGNLTVPKKFYKIIYSIKYNRSVAFLLNTDFPIGSIYNFDMSVQKLNEIIHIQYFPDANYSKRIGFLDREFWN